MTEDTKPFAASVRRPDPDALPSGVDYADDMFPPPEYGKAARSFSPADADEEARRAGLGAPPAPKVVITGEERGRIVSQCVDAILGQGALIYGAGDLLMRRLAEEVGVTVEEADVLVADEIAMRRTAK